jgi:hypothetical protein
MDPLTPALTVLSAMITPVVIISACASLIISTSSRAVRAVDRLHRWSEEFADLADRAPQTEAVKLRRAMLFEQLDQLTSRARPLQRSLATSAAIAVVAIGGLLELEWQLAATAPYWGRRVRLRPAGADGPPPASMA